MNSILFPLCHKLERIFAKLQGKGYGATSIEREYASALRLMARQPVLVIDIGANKGEYTAEIVKKSPDAEIHSFEPASINGKRLNLRFSGNGRVRINNFALSDTHERRYLYTNFPGSGLASLTKRRLDHFQMPFEPDEEVECQRFEDYWRNVLNSRPIDLVKIDVEGNELAVLRGFGEALKAVSLIQFEMGGCNIDTRTFLQDFWYLLGSDFDFFRVSPIGLVRLESYRETDEFFSTSNYFASRRD
jgi:FkbM family methyltransferase